MKFLIAVILCLFTAVCPAPIVFNGSNTELANTANSAVSASPLGDHVAPMSLAFWIKRYATNSDEIFYSGAICSDFDMRFNNAASNRLEFYYTYAADGSDHVWSSPPNIGTPTNRWMHVAFSFDPGPFPTPPTVFMWINGTNVPGSWTTGAGNLQRGTCGSFHMGRSRNSFSYFKGELDQWCFLQGVLLNDRQVNLLSSRQALMPLSIVPRQTSLNSTVLYLMNDAPEGGGLTAVGSIHDVSLQWHASCNPTGTVTVVSSKVLSYPPNQ